jgi:hypothetical protein
VPISLVDCGKREKGLKRLNNCACDWYKRI